MTTAASVLLVVAIVAALVDWVAVAQANKPLEYVCKPLTTAALVGVAATLDPNSSDQRIAFVIALVFSLAGDVALMLPSDRFVVGLASFLLAHLAYIVGFAIAGGSATRAVIGVVVVAVLAIPLARRYLRALSSAGRRELIVPVALYMSAIAAMFVSAIAVGEVLAIAGAYAFYVSDSLIAETRFVGPRSWGPLAIIVTYHVAQVMLVVSLVS
ncbi:MAG: lysoplasmalogenase [Acidimicrobiia bacterium]|nr:lysoplasmalogenase [Acidimicrobiia bacterium]